MTCTDNEKSRFFEKLLFSFFHMLVFFITSVPFFLIMIFYVEKNASSVIYMDKVRLLAQSIKGIMDGNLGISDYFMVHSGHFSPGTYMILSFEVKVIDLNNDYILMYAIPCLLYLTLAIIWACRLSKSDLHPIKGLIFSAIFGVVSSAVIFSLYCWEVIWFSYGFIIFLSNFFFVLSAALLHLSLRREKFFAVYVIASTIIGVLAAFLFGSGYSYAFALAIMIITAYIFIEKIRKKSSSAYFYLGSFVTYFAMLVFLVIILLKGGGSGEQSSGFSIIAIIKMYIYSLGSLFISSEFREVPVAVHYIAGSAVLLASLITLFIYIKKKYFTKNVFLGFLFLFSEATLASVSLSRLSFGIYAGDASRYYPTYMFLSIFIIDVLLAFIYEKTEKHQVLATILKVGASIVYSAALIVPQIIFIPREYQLSGYRKLIADQMVYDSLLYEERDDDYLSTLYQADPNDARECFDLLKEYSLYTYSLSCPYLDMITDKLQTTDLNIGLYDHGSTDRFTSKLTVFFLKYEEDTDLSLRLYNPGNFKANNYTLYLNSEIISNSTNINPGELKQEVLHCKKGLNKIKIILDHDTCPKEEGMSDDERRLGVIISNGQ